MSEFETRAINAMERIAMELEKQTALMIELVPVHKEQLCLSREHGAAYLGWIECQKKQETAIGTLRTIQQILR